MSTELDVWRSKVDTKFELFKKELANFASTMKAVKITVNLIKDNELVHQGKDIQELKTNMKWVMRIQWALVTGLVSNLIGVIYLIIK